MSIREIMPHIPPRWDGHNQWYFVTVITQKRQLLFADTDPCEILKQAFREERKHHPFRLAGLVILPDHWHALIRPNDGGVIETIVGNIKKKAWSDIAAPRPTIWQPRFLDHRIRNQEDFAYHLEYIRLNAIKHGYAESPEEYQWCFIHQHPFGK
jgi:putative transposase